eukprot:TRINITY_DN7497_c0_g1_i1.p1 TRINITY_DN7497_c0_g1~~TRINITY_DN7497_c0_g1_i1.p1  ORF type:complete len:551 (+),score=133.32 TRINITY_DN7497_c0_g1_i1:78-1655(+)
MRPHHVQRGCCGPGRRCAAASVLNIPSPAACGRRQRREQVAPAWRGDVPLRQGSGPGGLPQRPPPPPRDGHGDFPAVLPRHTEGEELLEFDEPMMRHERYDRDVRMHAPEHMPLSRAQRAVLEQRLDSQLRGRVRAAELSARVQQQLGERVADLRSSIWVGDEIPDGAERIRITHLGTVDGQDVAVDGPPLVLGRDKAFAQARQMGMTLCCVRVDGDEAYCRLRHLDAWLGSEARRRIAEETAQQQCSADRVQAGMMVTVRANIDCKDLQDKAKQMCEALYEGRRIRVQVKHCACPVDAAAMLLQVCEYVQQAADRGTEIAVHFRQELPVFCRTGAMMVLAPLGEGRTETELIPHRTLMQLAHACQRMDEVDFERKVIEEGPQRRQQMEEARRRAYYGAQEDFLGVKIRDKDTIAKMESWSEPTSPFERQQIEHMERMRLAGQAQIMEDDFTCSTRWTEQDIESPQKTQEMIYGTEEFIYGGRDPMQYVDAEISMAPGHPVKRGVITEPSLWGPRQRESGGLQSA